MCIVIHWYIISYQVTIDFDYAQYLYVTRIIFNDNCHLEMSCHFVSEKSYTNSKFEMCRRSWMECDTWQYKTWCPSKYINGSSYLRWKCAKGQLEHWDLAQKRNVSVSKSRNRAIEFRLRPFSSTSLNEIDKWLKWK